MKRGADEGTCHICGKEGRLSFEHVPPRAAFNDRRAVLKKIDLMSGAGPRPARRKVLQKGVGAYTLCPVCNNNTGSWYGPAYVEWAKQGLEALDRCGWGPLVGRRFRIHPLRVLKQVMCMFFSVNGPGFAQRNRDLVNFVLSREQMHLRPDTRIYAFYTTSKLIRQTGVQGLLRIGWGPHLLSEVTFPPFGYAMFLACGPHDPRLYDISFFGEYGYGDQITVDLVLPHLPVETSYPGDYRTPQEIHKAFQENLARERERRVRSDASGS